MHRIVVVVAAALLIVVPRPAPGGESPDPAALALELGSPEFPRRERASAALWALGEAARPALTAALRSDDAEVAWRARRVLDRFDTGDLPGVPPEVVRLMRVFRGGGDPAKQLAAYRDLRERGPTARPYLRTLLARPLPFTDREGTKSLIAQDLAESAARLLLDGRGDEAGELLALNTLVPTPAGLNDTVTLARLRSRLPQAVAALEAADTPTPHAEDANRRARVVVYRAAGRGRDALKLAAEIERYDGGYRPVRDALLEAAGDWATLAARGEPDANSAAGLTAFRLRLAGRGGAADEVLRKEVESGDYSTRYTGSVDSSTLALFANGRPVEAVARLKAQRNAPQVLADVLAAQMKFAEAGDLLADDGDTPDAPRDRDFDALKPLYLARQGKIQARLGERDAAERAFADASVRIAALPGNTDAAVRQLVRAEIRANRPDLACRHLGDWFDHPTRTDESRRIDQSPFETLFDGDAAAAKALWDAARLAEPEAVRSGAILQRIRRLFRGEGTASEVEAALKHLADAADKPSVGEDGAGRPLAIAAICRAVGRPADAIAALARHADSLATSPLQSPLGDGANRGPAGARGWVYGLDETFGFWVELGDLLTDQGRHAEAATRLLQGAAFYPRNPVLLDLAGRAKRRAGDEAGAVKLIEAAHAVPLGDARLRGRYLQELLDRGLFEDAIIECDLIRDCGWLGEGHMGNVWNQVARASNAAGQYAVAAEASRKAIHVLLRSQGMSYVEGAAYLGVPTGVRCYEAQAAIAAGRFDDGVAGFRAALAAMPGGSDQVITAVAALDRAGRKADADALFRQAFDAYRAVLKAQPKSAWARHCAAWLASGCRREPALALEFAQGAVAAEPAVENYREGLAEAQFRRGDRAAALAAMRPLAARDPRNWHFARQLARYERGAFDSPLPDAGD